MTTLEHPLHSKKFQDQSLCLLTSSVVFFSLGCLPVSQPGLELLYSPLFTKNVLKQYLHLNITRDCFHPSQGQESLPGTMTK